jgi:hypothetical protein
MEFEEIQEIWDLQKKQSMYTINERELHSLIMTKKKQAARLANATELMQIIVNTGAAAFVFEQNYFSPKGKFFLYLMAAWMLATAVFILAGRFRRIKRGKNFDQNMRGSLEQAIADATYKVRISQLMRWNIIIIALIIVLSMFEGGQSIWIIAGTAIFFGITYYASGYEHRCYISRKRELLSLYEILEQEQSASN